MSHCVISRYGLWGTGHGLGEPGIIYFMGEELVVPAQGYLSTRIYIDCHQIGSIMGGKLESCEKGYLAIRHTLCV